MPTDQPSADELRSSLSLRELFERDGHELKKSGPDTWKCRCPFHEERSASCVVHDQRGYFKCFGCPARGTIFEYWALSRGLDKKGQFREICHALTELVKGHLISPPNRQAEPIEKEKERPELLAGKDLERWREGCNFLALHPAEQSRIAEWRGYQVATVKALAEAGKMGLPRYFGKRLPAMAVETVDEQGEPYLAGFHVRLEPESGQRAMWHYVPKGIGAWPFVLGDPRSCKALVILEGQWDAVAFADALDQGIPPRSGVAILGARGAQTWERVMVWPWDEEKVQVWLYADGDEAGMKWLHDEEGFAWSLRRRCRALHAHAWEGVKDFNDAHLGATAVDRAQWSEDLRETLRRQWRKGLRTRAYRPKRTPTSKQS